MENHVKKLVIYYSLDGNTAFIAKTIAEATGADVLELKLKKPFKAKGPLKFFLAGMQVFLGKKPELLPLEKNPAEYDVVFIGTPIWAGNYNPAFRTFFSTKTLKGKKVALFCSCADNGEKAFENMKNELVGNEFLGEMGFCLPLNNEAESAEKAKEWAQDIIK
jgi:flavodoxin